MTSTSTQSRPFRHRANHFLHWREDNGGAVRWDKGGAQARRRNRERQHDAASSGLVPTDRRIEASLEAGGVLA
ncbi:hypothetical protein [Kaistia sp. MMO-174]|uniref:hypothetical protein n=1 Tax=Kaistia sp. MMO-174 TaxID=3081256 RepID=UPI00301A4BA4